MAIIPVETEWRNGSGRNGVAKRNGTVLGFCQTSRLFGRFVGSVSIIAHLLSACGQTTAPASSSPRETAPAEVQPVVVPEGQHGIALRIVIKDGHGETEVRRDRSSIFLESHETGEIRQLPIKEGELSVYALPPDLYTIKLISGLSCGEPSFVVRDGSSALMLGTFVLQQPEAPGKAGTGKPPAPAAAERAGGPAPTPVPTRERGSGGARLRIAPPSLEEVGVIAERLGVTPDTVAAAPAETRDWVDCTHPVTKAARGVPAPRTGAQPTTGEILGEFAVNVIVVTALLVLYTAAGVAKGYSR